MISRAGSSPADDANWGRVMVPGRCERRDAGV